MKFSSLFLSQPLLTSLQSVGYHDPTPIQQKAIPPILKGRDLIGCAQTGTGKTAAFALPTLQRLMTAIPEPTGAARRRKRSGRRVIRSLILAPTRELAGQIGASFATYGRRTGLRHVVIFGGVGQGPQVKALQAGIDILVATPGRLLDLIGQGFIDLTSVQILILDEADQMLDMGFIHDLRKIIAHVPDRRQTLMFSATMPPEVRTLATQWLRRPLEVKVAPIASTPDRVSQVVYFVARPEKAATLTRFLRATAHQKTLVFSRTKRGADKIARGLQRDGIPSVAIHGNKSQSRREAVMRKFNSQHPPVLVATDLAARGLDFSNVSHVINFDLPDVPEIYVHRIGRTARAGASGQAVSFCGPDERRQLWMIEKLTGQTVPIATLPTDPGMAPIASGETATDRQTAESPQQRATDATSRDRLSTRAHRPGNRRRRSRPLGSVELPTGSRHRTSKKPSCNQRKQSGGAQR